MTIFAICIPKSQDPKFITFECKQTCTHIARVFVSVFGRPPVLHDGNSLCRRVVRLFTRQRHHCKMSQPMSGILCIKRENCGIFSGR